MLNYKVSIIIPVYNTAPYLSKCLDSVVGQTLKEIEIIIINDASTDNSQRIIEAYAARDSRIQTVVKEQNEGLGAARNVGIKMAKGEYIGFVDSDDWIDKEMFLSLYNKGIENDADTVVAGIDKVYKNGKIQPYFKPTYTGVVGNKEVIKLSIENREVLQCAYNRIQKREVIVKNAVYFPEGCFHEDFLQGFMAFFYSSKVALINQAYYYYRIHGNSIMSSVTHKHLLGIAIGIEGIKNTLQKEKKMATLESSFYKYTWLRCCHVNAARIMSLPLQQLGLSKKYSYLELLYTIMHTHHPHKTTKQLGFKFHESIAYFFFSNKILFMLFYWFLHWPWKWYARIKATYKTSR